jgi:hypothetical protein
VTSFLTSKLQRTLHNATAIDSSHILNNRHVGDTCDVIAIAVAVAAMDVLAADGNGRPTQRQNSRESNTRFCNRTTAAETIKTNAWLRY